MNISKFISSVALNWLPWVNRKEMIAQTSPWIVQLHGGSEAHALVPLLFWHHLQILYFVLPWTILPCSHTCNCSVNRHREKLLWILKNSKTESQAMYQVLLVKKCVKKKKGRKKLEPDCFSEKYYFEDFCFS